MIKQFVDTPVTTWELDDTTPRSCDCGFTAEACRANHCQRKKVATSGLVPDAKWPDTGL
jgi:hypothetical protein